jgi:hypothetical protein
METLRNDLSTLISLCCQLKSNPYWPWWLVNRDIWYYVCKHVLKSWQVFSHWEEMALQSGISLLRFGREFCFIVGQFDSSLWILQFHCENSLMWRTDWPPNKNWQSNVDICCSEHSCKQKDENNMLQLYSDFCPNIFKSTKDFISQYNHIACFIRFGLLHKMKWTSRTRSTEVQDHEE